MAKRFILFILQFCAFLGLMYVGGNWDVVRFALQIRAMQNHTTAFNPIPVIKTQVGSHILIADGLIFAAALYILILLFEAVRRRLKPWASVTTIAFLLAVALGFAMKFGLPPANL